MIKIDIQHDFDFNKKYVLIFILISGTEALKLLEFPKR